MTGGNSPTPVSDLGMLLKSPPWLSIPSESNIAEAAGEGATAQSSPTENSSDAELPALLNQGTSTPLQVGADEAAKAPTAGSMDVNMFAQQPNMIEATHIQQGNMMNDLTDLRVELVAYRQFYEVNRLTMFHAGSQFVLQNLVRRGIISQDITNDPLFKSFFPPM